MGYLAGQPIYGKDLTLNNDGTVTISLISVTHMEQYIDKRSRGHWYKIKGKGHSIYLTIGGTICPAILSII